ncbi:M16 family metallopeptidase [Rhodovibrionaceae bacterium A322]
MPAVFGLISAFLFSLFLLPQSAAAKIFDPTVYKLDNGMEVVVVKNTRAPIVMHMVWYKVGSADEVPGKSGLAHFLEHLLFKGTKTAANGEFSQVIARNGGQENAFTSRDYTGYYQTVAKDRLETMMRYEADRMENLVLSDELVLPERDVILEERRSRIDNNPSSQLGEMRNAALYLNHPYGRPVIGWEQEMRGLTTQDALDFYDRWYAPNNAILVVSGDVEPEEVLSLAEKYYGKVPAKAVPERRRVSEPRHWAPRRVEMVDPRAGQPWLAISYLAPNYKPTGEGAPVRDAYALQVLQELLSGSTGRLYSSLAIDKGIAASAGAGYSASSYDASSFSVSASPLPGSNLEEVEAELRSEIDRLLAEGVSDEEVEKAKVRLIDGAAFARDEVTSAARIIGSSLAIGLTTDELEAWPNEIEKVTAEEIMTAAKKVFQNQNSVTAVMRTKPKPAANDNSDGSDEAPASNSATNG